MQHYQVEIPTPQYWQRQIKCQQACPVHTDEPYGAFRRPNGKAKMKLCEQQFPAGRKSL